MIVTIDTNVLVYTTILQAAGERGDRARDLLDRGMRAGSIVLIFQTLTEFSHVAIRKAGIPVPQVEQTVDAWRAVFPVHAAIEDDLPAALNAVKQHKLSFWDAMLWATARRVGVRMLLSEDFQDGRLLDGVRFVNPFDRKNDDLIDTFLPA